MAKLEFIKNNMVAGLFPIGSKIRKHFRRHRWPIIMRVARHVECSEESRVIHSSSCPTDCARVAYKNRSGTTYCSKLNWRLVSE